ncbi:hypothetical protein GTP56_06085 [Duganella sp. FT134W]|uniref:Uncharacterized protein n=1 Tax=Duganella margarita TaxID=2692170 RepID=A0A7X4KG57_9BURK|nr:hypothetical protein [Duganella margarita]MYM71767.1 hypothetical protein [Duganella margarita]
MDAEQIKKEISEAIKFAVERDASRAAEDPCYAESEVERRASRGTALLIALAVRMIDDEPVLHLEIAKFLDFQGLPAEVAKARDLNKRKARSLRKQLAGSRYCSRCAPRVQR